MKFPSRIFWTLLIAFTGFFGETALGQNKIINVNLYSNGDPYNDAAWNNWEMTQSLAFNNFKYSDGTSSTIGAVLSNQTSYSDNTANYITVTMCPQKVARYTSWHTSTRTLTLNQLDGTKLYKLEFYATRLTGGQTTRFTVGGVNVDIATSNNTSNVATFDNISPSAGSIVVTVSNLATYNYINGFTITEKPTGNSPPVANAGPDQIITLPVNSVTLNGSATDADGTIATHNWSFVSGPVTPTIVSAGNYSTNVTGLTASGNYTFRLSVTDNNATPASDDIVITVNQPPVANAGPDQIITLPVNSVTLNGSATDADGTIATHTWSFVSGPVTPTIVSAGNYSTNVTGLTASGTYTFRLSVTDNNAAPASDDIIVTVNPAGANQPPVANAGPDQIITLPVNSVTLNGSATDADGTIATHNWSFVSGPVTPTIVSAGNYSTNVTGLTASGTYTFRLSVTDNNTAPASDDIIVTVNPANQPPVANAGPDQIITLPVSSVTLNGSATDADGTIATHTWSFVSGPVTPTIVSAGNYSTNVTGLTASGTYTFRLSVTDNNAAPASDDIVVTVLPVSAQNKIINVNLYSNGDPYNDAAWNNWEMIQSLAFNNFKYSDGTSSTIDAVLSNQTSYSDNTANYITVTMCPQRVARYTSWHTSTRTLTLNQLDGTKLYKLEFYATRGTSGQTTRFTVGGINVDIATNNNTSNVATFDNISPSAGSIVVTVSNLATYNYINGFTITEKPTGNSPPVANAGPDQIITLPVNSVTLNGSATDADGTIATHNWSFVSGPVTPTIVSAGNYSTNVTGLTASGNYTFRLSVTDNNAAPATDDIVVTVNQPPVTNAGPDQAITLPVSSLTLNGSATDADGTIATHAWSFVSGPVTPTIVSAGNYSTNVTGLTASGTYTFRLSVTDNNAAPASDDVIITENPAPPPGNKFITVLGSSTAAGGGASTYDSSWVGRLQSFYRKNTSDNVDTSITNLAVSGAVTYHAMPTSFTPPPGRPVPNPAMNVTLAINGNPDIVLINFPSNDVASGYTNSEILSNFQMMYDSVVLQAHKICYVATSQPRNDITLAQKQQQKDLRDLILSTFGQFAINFWDDVSAADFTILPQYSYGDGIHLNNAGHKKLFERVVNANIFALSPPNQPPVANAGPDQAITLPVSSLTLNGSATDPDGTIATHAWSFVSGPVTPTIVSAGNYSTNVTGLTASGTYTFRLSVTDNNTAPASDDIIVTVNPANQPPVANAGPDQIITLPVSSVTLNGSATDADGTIATNTWSFVSGPVTPTIVSAGNYSTNVTGLTASGTYTFRLSVTDNNAAPATDDIVVTVNQPPVANAGADQTITIPVSSATLNGSATDADGTIITHTWSFVSGPVTPTIASAGNYSTSVTGLTTSGNYTFRLSVTDNNAASATDDIVIAILPANPSVLDPNDPVINYNSGSPPTQPAWGVIGKWVRTPSLGWNTDSYKAYIYKGNQFRLKFPKTYNPAANDGKKYPMLIFFHGLGEAGNIYNNEYSLYHGGQIFNDAVDAGTFDGYIFVMQTSGFWGTGQYDAIREVIDYMVINNKLDAFHVIDNGLSGGAQGTWEMLTTYPYYIAASLPMSGVYSVDATDAVVNTVRYTPMWNFHGGVDGSPAPYTAQQVLIAMQAAGANYKDTMYAGLGHGIWYNAWAEPGFWPFVNVGYMANPWPLYGRTEFCPGDPINVTIGLVAGLNGYKWRKNGVLINGATSNTIQVTDTGSYDAQILRGSVWSDWSRVPVHIVYKTATITPDITTLGLMSKVIPDLNGNNSVTLQVPAGYASYLWQKVGNPATLSTIRTLNVTVPGDYIAKVAEQYTCSSNFSNPFTVINANGPSKPDAPINLGVATVSKTSLRLDWSDNPTPQFNETNFEIYRTTQVGGPYTFIGAVGADVLTYTANGLNANTKYYFKVRAVNNTAASGGSNEASGTTAADTQAPTTPMNLIISASTPSSISLQWDASTDDVGVTQYYIYVNGLQSYTTSSTQFTVFGLQFQQSCAFSVRARDQAGNLSPFSNQVSGQAILMGLNYKYYTFTGTWNNLPDFNTLTPVVTGTMPNVAITPRTQDDNFAFLWEGYIQIPITGTYIFRTNSDDGSKLYLGPINGTTSPYSFSGPATVNNDGLHPPQDAYSAALNLTAGIYPIAMTFYEQNGGENMNVYWSTPSSGGSFVTIPNNAFTNPPANNGQPPAEPSDLVTTPISYKQINLSWTDNSSNETGFEIWRSTNSSTGFVTIGLAPAGATSYFDSTLNAGTTYYYKLRAIGQYGESALVSNMNFTEAVWQFNNDYNDASGNGRTLTPTGNPVFDASNKKEGSHSVTLNGTSQYATMPTAGSFLQSSYSQKSIAFWMRSASNTGNRIIADIGGSDNGLALRLDQNLLYAGITGNSTARNFNIPYNYASTVWNHIALVYSGNTLRLYLNGVLTGSDNGLPFTSLGTTSNGSRIGTVNGTNAFSTGTGFFGGWIDNFGIYSKSLSVADINNLMNNQPLGQSFATTLAAPAVPVPPTGLLASAISTSKVNITWTDNSTNETKFELYRSANNNFNYLLLATLNPNTVSYIDSGLFANAIYYYKVRSVGIGGNSGYSNEDSAKLFNNNPVVTLIPNQHVHYGMQLQVNVQATDADGEAITLSASNLPPFASFTQGVNGTGVITFNPAITNQGVFNNITIQATDQHSGTSSGSFSLTVNSNYDPVINPISNYTINEDDILNINLTATDQNAADILSWSVSNLPNAFTLTPGANGTATLSLHPNFAAAGTYVVQVNVTDGNGGSGTRQFNLTVNDKLPLITKVYVRFQYQTVAGSPWNNITGIITNNLKDDVNTTTSIGLQFQNSWWATYNEGPNGNGSGVYPDAVLKEYLYFGQYPGIFSGPVSLTAKFTGLDASKKYNITFYSGSIWSVQANNGVTTYTIGTQTVSLNVQNNTQNTATISGITPAADGTITFTVGTGTGTLVGFINAIVLNSVFDDGSVPADPKTLTAQNVPQGVQLNWQDVAYNETSYEIDRSIDGTSFAPIGSVAANTTSYTDNTVSGYTQYYYKVKAINSFGQSNFSNVVSIVAQNRPPVVNPIANVFLKNNQTVNVNVTATDDPGDNIKLTASGLPTFATFTDNGNGTGVVNIAPTSGIVGTYYNVTITATDNSNASRSTSFNITVGDRTLTSTYINFTDGVILGPQPWSNFVAQPYANASLTNITDENNAATGMTVTLLTNFQWYIAAGMKPGNGKTIYPESVMRTALYEGSTATRSIRISGLLASRKYNFVFFNSHEDGFKGLTNFTINGQTVSLNATYNIDKTVQINGISPDVNGQVIISIAKAAGQDYAYLSTLIVQSYPTATTLLSPSDLRVNSINRNSVTIQWQDRAFDETGYEIWRATDSVNGSYTRIATLAQNNMSYTNISLTPNTTYYYKVRAMLNSSSSDYSNAIGVTTYAYAVYVNYANTNMAPTPWNNTMAVPQQSYVWNNFKDETGIPTNVGMTITKNFDGLYGSGMTTGNNSGVVPDNVMLDSYGLFPGNTANFKVSGLNLSMKYDLTFFASSTVWGDLYTAYTVNGKTVLLDASVNTTGTVTMYGVAPDVNGEISIGVAPGYPTSQFGLIGGLIIQGSVIPAGSSSSVSGQQSPGARIITTQLTAADQDDSTNKNAISAETKRKPGTVLIMTNIAAYPNPFRNDITLVIPAGGNDKVQVTIYNANGKVVYSNRYNDLVKGNNFVRITAKQMFASGIYWVTVTYINKELTRTLKIIKQ